MSNNWFQFKHFKIFQDKTAMKVGVDSVLLGSLASFNNPKKVLDIGTGTGLLAFMAEQRTHAKIIAVEIDQMAYEQCLENVNFNHKEDKIQLIHSSFQVFSEKCDFKFDHIICNPPYFNNTFVSPDKSRNTARQNSHLSCEELIPGVNKLISADGIFSIIIPSEYVEEYMQLSLHYHIFCFKKVDIIPRDGKQANRCILEFSKRKLPMNAYEIILRNSVSNEYTLQYKTITKDFYLAH